MFDIQIEEVINEELMDLLNEMAKEEASTISIIDAYMEEDSEEDGIY